MSSLTFVPDALWQSIDIDVASLEAQQAQYLPALVPQYIANRLLRQHAVEYVFVSEQKGVFSVWTVVDLADESEYDAIYLEEAAIIQDLQPREFDFHVVTRRGRPLRNIITLSCRGWRNLPR